MSSAPLIDDVSAPSATSQAAGNLHRLQVVANAGAPLSAAAKAYNLQLGRINKLKSQLAEMETLSLAHRQALAQFVFPLDVQHKGLMKKMAFWLDGQLQRPTSGLNLTPEQRRLVVQMVCSLSAQLVQAGHADMAAVHDRHSPQTLAELERAHAQRMKAQLEAMLGEPLMPDEPDASLDDVMQAARARMQQAAADELAAREATAAKRKAKKAAKAEGGAPNAAQQLQQALQGDANTSLRTLYRQLASALHPDREPDAAERHRKNALMSEANAAYARQDIVTLMDIQQRIALADPQAVASMTDDKLKSLTLLVKAQVAELERERARTQRSLCAEFDVPNGMGLTVKTLQMVLTDQEDELTEALERMQADLAQVQQPSGFKRWLNDKRKASEQLAREQALRNFMDERGDF